MEKDIQEGTEGAIPRRSKRERTASKRRGTPEILYCPEDPQERGMIPDAEPELKEPETETNVIEEPTLHTSAETETYSHTEAPPPWLNLILQQLNTMSQDTSQRFDAMAQDTAQQHNDTNKRLDTMSQENAQQLKTMSQEINIQIGELRLNFEAQLERQNANLKQELIQQRTELKEEMAKIHHQVLGETQEQLESQAKSFQSQLEDQQEQTRYQCAKYTDQECKTLRTEVNNKIAQNHGQLDESVRLIERNSAQRESRLDELEREVRDQKAVRPQQITVTCAGAGSGGNFTNPPTFHGREHNPMEHIKKILRYYERRRQQCADPNDIEILRDTLDSCMDGHASRWFSLVKPDISTWEEFECIFEARYWSREVQRSIKQRMDIEKFRAQGKLSRAEYFIERVITLRAMQPPLSEGEIVTCLSEHFEPIVQDACRVQNIQGIRDLEILLQREDAKDLHNRTRRNSFPTSTPRTNNSYQDRGPERNPQNRTQTYQFSQGRPPFKPSNYSQPNFNPPRQFNPNPGYYRNNGTYQGHNNYRGPPPPLMEQRYAPPQGNRPAIRYQNDHPNERSNPRNNPYPTREQVNVCQAVADRVRAPSPTQQTDNHNAPTEN